MSLMTSEERAIDLVRDETIPEIASNVRLYRHKKTGAEVISAGGTGLMGRPR